MADQPVLDHIVLDVHAGMDAAVQRYRALGFQITERGHHTLGSINHLAIFGTDYLELLGWDPARPGRAELASFPLGLNGLVFKTDSADASHDAMAARGVAVRPAQSFSRPVVLPGGSLDAKFRTTHVAGESVPFGRLYVCQHDTPELVWRPAWQVHPNGVQAVDSLVIAADQPAAVAGLFARAFGDAAIVPQGSGKRLEARGVAIDIFPTADVVAMLGGAAPQTDGLAARMAVLRLRTSSLDTAATALRASGIPFEQQVTLLRVAAPDAGNVVIEFTA